MDHYEEFPELLDSVKKKKPEFNEGFFDLFWSKYPIKKGKEMARKSFVKLNPSQELLDSMILAIQDQANEKKKAFLNDKFCPDWRLPTTWLNQRGWEDEIQDISYSRIGLGSNKQCMQTGEILRKMELDAKNKALNPQASIDKLKETLSSVKH